MAIWIFEILPRWMPNLDDSWEEQNFRAHFGILQLMTRRHVRCHPVLSIRVPMDQVSAFDEADGLLLFVDFPSLERFGSSFPYEARIFVQCTVCHAAGR